MASWGIQGQIIFGGKNNSLFNRRISSFSSLTCLYCWLTRGGCGGTSNLNLNRKDCLEKKLWFLFKSTIIFHFKVAWALKQTKTQQQKKNRARRWMRKTKTQHVQKKKGNTRLCPLINNPHHRFSMHTESVCNHSKMSTFSNFLTILKKPTHLLQYYFF